jgi:hypothetical protein
MQGHHMKKIISAFLILMIPVAAAAHPGGGLSALDANTVIFGDSMYNSIWRLEKGKKPQALVKNFHAHCLLYWFRTDQKVRLLKKAVRPRFVSSAVVLTVFFYQ